MLLKTKMRNLIYVVIFHAKNNTLAKLKLAISDPEIKSGYTGNIFDSLNMKNVRQKDI